MNKYIPVDRTQSIMYRSFESTAEDSIKRIIQRLSYNELRKKKPKKMKDGSRP